MWCKIASHELQPPPSGASEHDKLGEGAQGYVYRAYYKLRPVAVKVSFKDHEIVAECRLLKKLNHENVVHLIGYGVDKQTRFIVMELGFYCLFDLLMEAYIPWNKRLDIAIGILNGLRYLHSQNPPILHRDLKSLNIMFSIDFRPFIIDFTLAKELVNLNVGKKGVGSINWMSPEMLDPDEIITLAVDTYGFGMILYELLTFHIPFENQTNIRKLIREGKRPEIPVDETLYPSIRGCPNGFIDLMKSCWQQAAIKRPNLNYILAKLLEMQIINKRYDDDASKPQSLLMATYNSSELFCQLFDSLSLLPPKLVTLTLDYWIPDSNI